MLTRSAQQFLQRLKHIDAGDRPATPRAVMLMAPRQFGVAADCASDNAYMVGRSPFDQALAQRQLRALAEAICDCGVPVVTLPGLADTPDAVFPNNVFATLPGRLVIGAMRHPSRQRETRRDDVRALFASLFGYEVVDLGTISDCIAELTGAVVIDRARGLGFHGLSQRLNPIGAQAIHEALELEASLVFDLAPGEYHTNILLSVLASRAAVVYPSGLECGSIVTILQAVYGDRVVMLDDAEKNAFAGNCIALTDCDLFFSDTALRALRPATLDQFERMNFVLHGIDVSEIEKAGGSLRCMVAEIY